MADKKFLDEDGVSQFAEETKKYVDKHADNADIHVTAADKANWNGKQDALTAEQLAAVNSGISATDKGNYDAHIANADIHVTTADKANWNGKQDALTSQQLANIADVVNKANASDLSAVATSGSYNDLSDKPTIPTVNNATLTIQKNGTTVETFTANASSNVTANITVPTKTSELTNDSGFLTTHNPVDDALSSTSTNAVQNKVINTALDAKANVSDLSNYLSLDGGWMRGNIHKSTNDGYLYAVGGTGYGNGSAIFLYGKDSGQSGAFSLIANNGTSSYGLDGYPNGALTWNNKNLDVIEEQGDNYIRYANGIQIVWLNGVFDAQGQDMWVGLPKPFIGDYTVLLTGNDYFTVDNNRPYVLNHRLSEFSTYVIIRLFYNGLPEYSSTTGYHMMCIGKWK